MDTIHKDLHQILIRVAFLAADCKSASVAEQILKAVCNAKPNHESAIIGLAYNAILSDRFDEAVSLLKDQALAINPNNHTARAYLGLALGCKGDKEASKEILEELVKKDEDSSAVNLAKLLLSAPKAA